jgi:hypothetical protein
MPTTFTDVERQRLLEIESLAAAAVISLANIVNEVDTALGNADALLQMATAFLYEDDAPAP